MASIIVRIGNDEKEISGLTRKTTCTEVIQALLKDKQTLNKLSVDQNGLIKSDKTSLRELAKNFAIFEDWRGCEKSLPSQTRIFAVWQAWGKEQCNVKFLMKKDKTVNFLDKSQERLNCVCTMTHNDQPQNRHNSSCLMPPLSHDQKKRIRRSMLQYQRAMKLQQSKFATDNNNNSSVQMNYVQPNNIGKKWTGGTKASISRQAIFEKSLGITVTLSEEQFVDGVVSGPDCILQDETKSKFMLSALDTSLCREQCTYRRPHHRRRSQLLDDSDGLSDQNSISSANLRPELYHYPYCSKSRRRSSSSRKSHNSRKRRSSTSKHSKRNRYSFGHYSTDSTSSGTPCSESENEKLYSGEDADDEKSVMTEYGSLLSRQKLAASHSKALSSCVDRYGKAAVSTTSVAVTDSGTTTCSDTSNTSSSSLSATSSSETSVSSTDLFNEVFFAKRAPETVPTKVNSTEKAKGGTYKLFKIAKPAQSIISSFKKKKRNNQPSISKNTQLAPAADCKSQNDSTSVSSTPKVPNFMTTKRRTIHNDPQISLVPTTLTSPTLKTPTNHENQQKVREHSSIKTKENLKDKLIEDCKSRSYEQLQQQIVTQERILNEKCSKVHIANANIQEFETQLHKWRTQSHGENYVQDIYLSELDGDVRFKNENLTPHKGIIKSPWYKTCKDIKLIEDYLQLCENVVGTQISIEENKRQTEILLQHIQEEVWKLTQDSQLDSPNNLTALALGLMPSEVQDNASDDETNGTTGKSLSVTTRNRKNSRSDSKLASDIDILEKQRSKAEMEANLNLSLRLSSEIDEVEKLMCNAKHLLQSKGEQLLHLVRELALSAEGISPDLWEEYGELLVAYDAEISLLHYLEAYAEKDNLKQMQAQRNAVDLDAQRRIMFNDDIVIDPIADLTDTSHQVDSPLKPREHCKHDLQLSQKDHELEQLSHWLNHSTNSSQVNQHATRSPSKRCESCSNPLLPMPPIPDYNESDYEEILPMDTKADDEKDTTSTIISTEDVVPRGIVFRHNSTSVDDLSLPASPHVKHLFTTSRNSSSTGEDSGNASGSSISSSDCASTDIGSRNGSPRPPSVSIESQDSDYSSPLFLRDHMKRSNSHTHFTFPSRLSSVPDTKERLDKELTSSKLNHATPKPPIPPKSFAVKQAAIIAGDRDQQKKLVRRNSSMVKRTSTAMAHNEFSRRATSFGKSGIKPPLLPKPKQKMALMPMKTDFLLSQKKETGMALSNGKKIYRRSSSSSSLPLSNRLPLRPLDPVHNKPVIQKRSSLQHIKVSSTMPYNNRDPTALMENKICYENDSDTGLSSMHSNDSLAVNSGETLV